MLPCPLTVRPEVLRAEASHGNAVGWIPLLAHLRTEPGRHREVAYFVLGHRSVPWQLAESRPLALPSA